MLFHAASYFALSVLALVGLSVLVGAEQSRGQRFFAASARAKLDRAVAVGETRIAESWAHFTRYVIELGWYHSLQSLLRAVIVVLRQGYEWLERVRDTQRARAARLQAEQRQVAVENHLRQMAEHKQGTALTPAQKRKLKQRKLEERH